MEGVDFLREELRFAMIVSRVVRTLVEVVVMADMNSETKVRVGMNLEVRVNFWHGPRVQVDVTVRAG